MTMTNDPSVSQEAREAAASVIAWHNIAAAQWRTEGGADLTFFAAGMPDEIKRGIWDEHEIVQAFASFEQQILSRATPARTEGGEEEDPDAATGCADDALPGSASQWRDALPTAGHEAMDRILEERVNDRSRRLNPANVTAEHEARAREMLAEAHQRWARRDEWKSLGLVIEDVAVDAIVKALAASAGPEVERLREAVCRMLTAYRELRVQFNIHEEQAEHVLFALDVVGSDDDDLRQALSLPAKAEGEGR